MHKARLLNTFWKEGRELGGNEGGKEEGTMGEREKGREREGREGGRKSTYPRVPRNVCPQVSAHAPGGGEMLRKNRGWKCGHT